MLPAPYALPVRFATDPPEGLPAVHRLPAEFSLAEAFDRLQALPGVLWLDSVTHPSADLGRYSFLSADPVRTLTLTADASQQQFEQALAQLSAWAQQLPSYLRDDLPPFQGGIAGLFGYELNRAFESIPPAKYQDLAPPALAVGLYDWAIASDHATGDCWLISQGMDDQLEPSRQRAEDRINQVLQWLVAPAWPTPRDRTVECRSAEIQPAQNSKERVPAAPRFPTHRDPRLTSNFSPDGFRHAVATIIESIKQGDAFQVNLSQRLLFPANCPPGELYRRLRRENPAPEAGYFDAGVCQVLSSSPETFLRVRRGRVETRPIKGTCPRSGDERFDAELAADLLASEKDLAENVMIVDLMRNDLSRVCKDTSVRVEQLCRVEPYAFVQHLVSVVSGQLQEGQGIVELLAACFPGGSVTGAPKVEAMQKIVALEQVPRGAYCGSLGYIGCGGMADFNILIRTITQMAGVLQIPVGGGITAASDPESEHRETWHKAEGLLRAIPI